MPKNEIDYSNTIIYSISCKDKTISDVYVGHTTNLIKRKCQHKVSYNNLNNKLKIYETIRKNGGWDNWGMKEIAIYNCKNKDESKYAGHVECTKGIEHMNFDILEYFYQKYGSKI